MAGSKAIIVLYQEVAVIGGIENYFVPTPLCMQSEIVWQEQYENETTILIPYHFSWKKTASFFTWMCHAFFLSNRVMVVVFVIWSKDVQCRICIVNIKNVARPFNGSRTGTFIDTYCIVWGTTTHPHFIDSFTLFGVFVFWKFLKQSVYFSNQLVKLIELFLHTSWGKNRSVYTIAKIFDWICEKEPCTNTLISLRKNSFEFI